MLNPSKLIVDHYEWLINQIEKRADLSLKSLENRKNDTFLPDEKLFYQKSDKDDIRLNRVRFSVFSGDKEAFDDPNKQEAEYDRLKSASNLVEPKSIRKSEYIKLMRDEMVAELNMCREETLNHYETNVKHDLDTTKTTISEDELIKKLFAQKNCFILDVNAIYYGFSSSPFSLYLFVLDFYMDRMTQDLLR